MKRSITVALALVLVLTFVFSVSASALTINMFSKKTAEEKAGCNHESYIKAVVAVRFFNKIECFYCENCKLFFVDAHGCTPCSYQKMTIATYLPTCEAHDEAFKENLSELEDGTGVVSVLVGKLCTLVGVTAGANVEDGTVDAGVLVGVNKLCNNVNVAVHAHHEGETDEGDPDEGDCQ